MKQRSVQRLDTKKLVMLALFAALAYISVALIRIPIVSFLKYEPKDCIIVIASFIYGPGAGALLSVAVSLLEMVTVSDTGLIGLLMNVLSTLLFVMPAALLYHEDRTLKNAVIGLIIGGVATTSGMLLWNYVVTPFYMNISRSEIAELLLPMFLPFNLLKSGLNIAISLLLYKRVVTILRSTRLLPKTSDGSGVAPTKRTNIIVLVSAALLLITLVLVLLSWRGVI